MFNSSAYKSILIDSLLNPDPCLHSIAWNLLHDWRIGAARLEDFENVVNEVEAFGLHPRTSGVDFQRAFSKCNVETVKKLPGTGVNVPAFLDSKKNGDNHYGVPNGLGGLAPDLQLVTVTDLSSLWRVFDHGSRHGVSEFDGYESPSELTSPRSDLLSWLDSKMQSHDLTKPQAHPFLKAVLRHTGATLDILPYEPTWVSLWEDFQEQASDDASNWQPLVGVPQKPIACWLLLLVYPVWQAGCLVRPSQMDAGVFEEHFPPPETSIHGLSMKLTPSFAHPRLPEFIHARVDHRLWLDDSVHSPIFSCVRLDGQPPHDLGEAQRQHLMRLESSCGSLHSWIHYPHPSLRNANHP